MLVSRATGGTGDDNEYKDLRREIISMPRINKLLPRFVHTCRTLDEFWNFIQPKFGSYAERREYLRSEFDALLTLLEASANSPSDGPITTIVQSVNSDYVLDVWHKALDRRASDPEGAITSARTLLESVCKFILDSAEISYEDNFDLPKLYALTAKQLNLSPSQHTEQLFKKILGGCQTVVEGIGAIRNQHSDAHGKGESSVRPAPRHAELAVNLAGATATFLLQTWEARLPVKGHNRI